MTIPTLAPEVLFHIGSIPVTNTIINTWVAIIIFLIVGLFISKNARLRPTKLQNFLEWALESVCEYFDQVTGDRKKTNKFLPLVGSVFFFILLSN
jgi:F-type H+-transporting ATPase subunit a